MTHKPKAKPKLDGEARKALAKRNAASRKRPAFRRQNWFRYKRLGIAWRKPRGMHSKMRTRRKYRPPVVSAGYRGPAAARGLHPSGFVEVLVHRPEELEALDGKLEAARIAATVGDRKREAIEARAGELEIRVLNSRGYENDSEEEDDADEEEEE
ncbi:MAG: 50S ribosomal protein L32e [Euryarchaeota archaeon]|jgi:large subunit ribosomal protein L32e|nr:50S ribosomal protein L32e [Euryarchaeota archaeon]MDP6363321.1 50S ribosomal protein L32e [Candidatus Poseidoniia archaeon]MDP6658195.1 50S ribosomal protein L32e [Candidatus Poseidoniia archaeon]MDP6846147.1 50S ribosomal protein L32e [Candidatus Poseidoniia archaeon]MDP7007357.1 50S ribosomal protein L32e [Candidatus Poseidoniia archaeon]|tara:strand:+ start:4447 stop:4911 length:465 start_codon:yes stop_codon:yes gene_type:complete